MFRQRLGHDARVAHKHHVGAVVLNRVAGVDVDREHARRLRLGPVLGARPVQVAADRDDQIGVVPQLPAFRHEGRQSDVAGVVRSEQARGLVGGDDRRGDLAPEFPNRVARAGSHGAAARPDERPLRVRDQLERRREVCLGQLRAPLVGARLGIGVAGLGQQ